MVFVDIDNDPKSFAEKFSNIRIKGTRFVQFRDVPSLIKKYTNGTKCLDYGCGAGESTLFLKSLGLTVDGVDVSQDILEKAKKRDPTGQYGQIINNKIPNADNQYDLVFSSFVFDVIDTKAGIAVITNEIARVLKPNGIFITINCNKDTYTRDWISYTGDFEENQGLQSGQRARYHFKDLNLTINGVYWSNTDLVDVIDKCGMKVIETHLPMGKDDEGYCWKTEKEYAPCTISVVRKI